MRRDVRESRRALDRPRLAWLVRAALRSHRCSCMCCHMQHYIINDTPDLKKRGVVLRNRTTPCNLVSTSRCEEDSLGKLQVFFPQVFSVKNSDT